MEVSASTIQGFAPSPARVESEPAVVRSAPGRRPADAVELSDAARAHVEQGEAGGIRKELVQRVRAEIAAGTYLTDDKIDAVVNRLHREMFGRE